MPAVLIDRRQRISSIIATALIAALIMVPIGAVLQIVFTAQFDDRTRTQAIVVLDGGPQWGDATEIRESRLQHAAELYRTGVAPVIVLTGRMRMADDVRPLFRQYGVSEQDVVFVPTTPDTVSSVHGVSRLLRDLGWQSITLVTDRPRAARASAIAREHGLDAHISSPAKGPDSVLSGEVVGAEALALLRHYALQPFRSPG
jgi:uncharacterized SAM-binding protein YcdF (DUF218 family)